MDEVVSHCTFLTPEEAVAFKDLYWHHLERAIADAEGRVEPDAVWQEIVESRAAVFVIRHGLEYKAAATVTVHSNDVTKWADIELCGGDDLESWVEIGIEAIRRYAEHIGCEYVIFEGRRGWEKVLRPLGFETRRIQATLRLH